MSVTVRKEMVGTRRLELLTSTVSTVRVPALGATCTLLPVPPSSSKYVQDGPTTGWKSGLGIFGKFGGSSARRMDHGGAAGDCVSSRRVYSVTVQEEIESLFSSRHN